MRMVIVAGTFMALMVSSGGCAASGQDAPPPLSVEVVLQKKTFSLGEDVRLTMVATNTTRLETRVSLESLTPSADTTHLAVVDHSEKPVRYVGVEADDYVGEKWQTLGPGQRASRQVNLAALYDMDEPGKYRVRCYATVGSERFYGQWQDFEVVAGKEAFHRDIEVTQARPQGPKREAVSLIVYALPESNMAYYKRFFTEDSKETTAYKRLARVDSRLQPQMLLDSDGQVHILVAERPLTESEIEQQAKALPSHRAQLEKRYFLWYRTRASDGVLEDRMRAGLPKQSGNELRLARTPEGRVEIHEFRSTGQDMGVYPPQAKDSKADLSPLPVESADSPGAAEAKKPRGGG